MPHVTPEGIWLSDENGGGGWHAWCTSKRFALDRLTHWTDFEVDLAGVLHLATAEDLRAFAARYGIRIGDYGAWSVAMDWERVAEDFTGVLITPYICSERLETLWYYSAEKESPKND